jgi:NTE family protein
MRLKYLFLALTLSIGLNAQERDLKIGLVLSGGGAKCMAQIGALKVIEEAGIQIDYIGGTSMGAIVGAMYSLGFSPTEIEAYLSAVNWDALLSNEIPRNRLSFFDRKAAARYILNFPVDSNGVHIPQGVNFAQYIMKELSTITQQSHPYSDFGELPIPFYCVATNLETGSPRVFENGRLIDALRASSAFPSLFTPYFFEDSLYIDGGVVQNYPVQIMSEKDMDYIIGIDMQDYLYDRDELSSIARVLEQTSGFLNARNQTVSAELTDIWIRPKIAEAGITTFELFDEIVDAGELETRKYMTELKKLAALDIGSSREKVKALPLAEFYVYDIQVNGLQSLTTDYVEGKLRIRKQQTCEIARLEKGIDQLNGTKYFQHIDYTLVPADTGYILNINLREEDYFQNLKVGINYSDDFRAALLVNYTNRKLFFKNSRLSIDLALGDRPRGELSYFVDRGYIPTLGVKLRSHRFQFQNYLNREAVNERIYQDYLLDLFLQSTWRDAYAIGGGVQLEDINITQNFDFGNFQDLQKGFINYYGFIDFDSYDDANFPRRGLQLNASYRIIAEREGLKLFREPSSVLEVSFRQAIALSQRWTIQTHVYGATTIGPDLADPYKIHFGSMGQGYINYIQPFVGYRFMELSGRTAVMLRGDLRYEALKNHFLQFKINYGRLESSIEGIGTSDLLLDGYSLGYVYNSIIGPLEFNLAGSTNHDDIYAFVRLGFWF